MTNNLLKIRGALEAYQDDTRMYGNATPETVSKGYEALTVLTDLERELSAQKEGWREISEAKIEDGDILGVDKNGFQYVGKMFKFPPLSELQFICQAYPLQVTHFMPLPPAPNVKGE